MISHTMDVSEIMYNIASTFVAAPVKPADKLSLVCMLHGLICLKLAQTMQCVHPIALVKHNSDLPLYAVQLNI